ncbi:hypothetical protein Syun_029401 [Stephania yunnanensis]|uniref:Uncharacterized protein n=1 Tax=Stephania yunnanensis TaxID=152371 RepID=A0AAP0E8X2_9MAGN
MYFEIPQNRDVCLVMFNIIDLFLYCARLFSMPKVIPSKVSNDAILFDGCIQKIFTVGIMSKTNTHGGNNVKSIG